MPKGIRFIHTLVATRRQAADDFDRTAAMGAASATGCV
jgi:hypothetical protein